MVQLTFRIIVAQVCRSCLSVDDYRPVCSAIHCTYSFKRIIVTRSIRAAAAAAAAAGV